ncbi:hypothetical protein I317_05418 [Kwoniella heveanensis CBS 569]|nr:hypothetical protein I317_05418 [Kwoniella heveanensis CBS 569]
MSTLKYLKRKASVSKPTTSQKKRPQRPPSPPTSDDSDQGTEDREDGEDDEGDAEGAGLYDDPMIDRQSSGSEDEDEEDDDDDGDEQEGEDDLNGGEENEEDVPSAGPSRQTQPSKQLYKAPTLEEMEALKSVESSGGTSFSLQLSALLNSTLLPTTPAPVLKALLSSLHSTILSLPTLSPLPPAKAYKRIAKGAINAVTVPSIGEGLDQWDPVKNDVKWTLGWDKPEEIVVGGSWGVVGGYKKGKGEVGNIDLVVVMPSAMFAPKDRMDYRYFHKRAHYLAVIFSALRQLIKKEGSLNGAEIQWSRAMEDVRRPIIIITAGKEQGLKHRIDIRIHASIPPSVFPLSTLSPTKSLLRTEAPTSLYSSSILHDTLQKLHLLHLHRLSQLMSPERTVDSFLAIWRIWANRRGLRRERGGSGWFASMVLGWVVDGGEVGGAGGVRDRLKKVRGVGKGLGHWGALRAAWEFLAHTDFECTPVFLTPSTEDTISSLEFTRAFPSSPILVDPTGRVNIFAEWEKGEVDLLRYHARETLAMLEDETAGLDHFANVFLRNQSLGPEVFDEFIRLDIASIKLSESAIERSGFSAFTDLAAHSVARVLRQGLSDRAALVHVSPAASPSTLQVGILLNREHATRVIDIGPSSDPSQAEKAEEFRQLWGDKAELRRFKDGSISESVVWDLSRPEDATLIPGKIVRHLLARHFSLSEEDVQCVSSNEDWQKTIQVPASTRNAVSIAGSEKLGFRPTISAYDELYRLLKDIDSELPLAILNVTPASEYLRYASTFVPHPVDINRLPTAPASINYVPYSEVVVQFESSPKWPDDLSAIQKVKLALFDRLARVIEDRLPGVRLSIVFDQHASEVQDHAALEILLPAGAAFRLRIYHDRERTLLERVVHEDEPVFATSLPRPPRRLAAPALHLHIRRFTHLPTHHSSIAPMHHRYPSYSSATRLLKRWFASHMLSTQISTEVTELIMAKVYLDPGCLSAPCSATTGFLRAIDLLANWDWKLEPMFVPIFTLKDAATSSSPDGRVRFPSTRRQECIKAFEGLRNKEKASISASTADLGAVVHGWVVFTEQDDSGLRWTKGISRVIAGRVGVLAKATLSAVKTASESGDLDVKSLFVTPLEHYDFLLHLSPSNLSRYSQSITADPEEWESKLKFRNIQSTTLGDDDDEDSARIKIDFDPASMFVADLQRIYGDSVLLFHDAHGGSVVGGIWNPARDNARSLKAFLGWSSQPVQSESALVTINKESILAEMARLGTGLITKVERRR